MCLCVCAFTYWNAIDFIGLWYEFDNYMFTKEELDLDLIQTLWYFQASYKVTTFNIDKWKKYPVDERKDGFDYYKRPHCPSA